jgi:hypothetical protein
VLGLELAKGGFNLWAHGQQQMLPLGHEPGLFRSGRRDNKGQEDASLIKD